MKSKIVTKADIVLAIALLVIGLASPFVMHKNAGQESKVVIAVNGQVIATEKLSESQSIGLFFDNEGKPYLEYESYESDSVISDGAENIIAINDGKVFVESARCSGKDCIKMGKISREGQIIACLPHKLLITIVSGEKAPDAVIY